MWTWKPDSIEHGMLAFMAVVLCCACWGGFAVGLTTTLASLLLSSYFFMEPLYSFRVDSGRDMLYLSLTGAEGLFVSWLFGRYRKIQSAHLETLAELHSVRASAIRMRRNSQDLEADLRQVRHEIITAIAPAVRLIERESSPLAVPPLQRVEDFLNVLAEYGPADEASSVGSVDSREALQEIASELLPAHVRIELPPVLPAVAVRQSDLRRIFREVLSHAIRSAPPDTLIQVTCEKESRNWRFAIADSASGMVPRQIAESLILFGPCAVDRANRLGASFAISRRIVRSYGGEMRLKSAPGCGTTVYFTLPDAAQR